MTKFEKCKSLKINHMTLILLITVLILFDEEINVNHYILVKNLHLLLFTLKLILLD